MIGIIANSYERIVPLDAPSRNPTRIKRG